MTRIDLTPERSAPDLVDALWHARRDGRRDLAAQVRALTHHLSPTVREEALSLIAVKWMDREARHLVVEALQQDDDFGVRSRAAGALAALSDDRTREEDVRILMTVVLNDLDHPMVRASAYEALSALHGREHPTLADDVDIDRDLDLTWVRLLAPGGQG